MSLNLPENDPFFKKQPIRIRKRRLQESSRLRHQNLHQELEALPLLKGNYVCIAFVRVSLRAQNASDRLGREK